MFKYLTIFILVVGAIAQFDQSQYAGDLSRQYLTQQFLTADSNNDKILDMDQLSEYVRANYMPIPIGQDYVRSLIKFILEPNIPNFDIHGDGIDVDEFINLQRKTSFQDLIKNNFAEELQQETAKLSTRDLLDQTKWTTYEFTRGYLTKKFKQYDTNNDKLISLKQYTDGSTGIFSYWEAAKKLVSKLTTPFSEGPFKKFDQFGDGLDLDEFIKLQRSLQKKQQKRKQQEQYKKRREAL